jgi:predicted transcriptional regulator
MSTIELKKKIIDQLSRIDDVSFLKAIKTLVDSKAHDEIYKLSEFQKERIREGREQLKKGQTISNETVQKEIDQWLGSK